MAAKPELTPWFPASVKPLRVGLYECDYDSCESTARLRLWTGRRWDFADGSGGCLFGLFGPFRSDRWRGLAHNPNGKD